ncbi:M23 family metallopeptidase [Gordonia hongkongensis]|uniref:M23 family metallopeptidase n=1 Tax=Gordonia hongkongensis TaxID=1701090 RepID=UPI003EBB128D
MPMSSLIRRCGVPRPCLRLGAVGIVAAVLLSLSLDARARADADDTHVAQQFAQLVAETISASLGGPAMGELADEIRTVSTCLADRARPVEPSEPTDDPITAVGCFAAVLSAGRAAAELVVDALPIGRLLALLAFEMRPHDPATPHPAPNGPPVYSSPSPGSVVAPTNGRITSTFGDGRGHQGMDIGNDLGAPIFAVTDGEVINSGPAQGFGLWVRIRHADGTVTTYGHNDDNLIEVAAPVTVGQPIATVGNRGNSTGPHLHFEVADASGAALDPVSWLAERGVRLPADGVPTIPPNEPPSSGSADLWR